MGLGPTVVASQSVPGLGHLCGSTYGFVALPRCVQFESVYAWLSMEFQVQSAAMDQGDSRLGEPGELTPVVPVGAVARPGGRMSPLCPLLLVTNS